MLPLNAGPRVARRAPDGWVDRPYTRFTVTPLAPTIGAEIGGVDLGRVDDDPYTRFTVTPLAPTIGAEIGGVDLGRVDDDLFADIHRALLEWKVLFFRDQVIDRAAQAAFARRFGELEVHPFFRHLKDTPDQPEDDPEVVRLAKGAAAVGYENMWHTDTTWRDRPAFGAVLRAVEVPAVGGDTLWADMGAAYDGLPDGLRARIDGMEAEHDWMPSFGLAMGAELAATLRPDFPAVVHPVVRTHPETGRRTLFVNRNFTTRILGLDPDESDALLDRLYRQADYPEYQCRFHWTAGAVAVWDNRATQHYASSDYFPQVRVMERVAIAGDRPR